MAENREFQHFMTVHSLLLAPTPASPGTSRTSTLAEPRPPLLEGTRRERQMVPGRKTLAQLWEIYAIP